MFVPVILCSVPFGWNGKETKRGQKKKKKKERREREKGWESKVEKEQNLKLKSKTSGIGQKIKHRLSQQISNAGSQRNLLKCERGSFL